MGISNWLLIWAFLLILAIWLSYKLERLGVCAFLLVCIVLAIAGALGLYAGSAVDNYLAPYVLLGIEKTRSQNIRMVDFTPDGEYVFSNGEKVEADESGLLKVIDAITFVLVGGTLFKLGRVIEIRLLAKLLPDLYKELEPYLMPRRTQSYIYKKRPNP